MTKIVSQVGPFVGCNASVIDLAIDATGNAWVTTYDGFYQLDVRNAHCTLRSLGSSYPNSLSFVPKGTLDPTVEALVGYSGSFYVRIDPGTGNTSYVGSLGSAAGTLSSSGDIVSVRDGGTYLTVVGTTAGGSSCNDCLVGVDPVTGNIIHNYGALPYSQVYGLAYWAGSLYGFSASGVLFQIDASDGGITTTAIPQAAAQMWYGAGSTTAAPPRDGGL